MCSMVRCIFDLRTGLRMRDLKDPVAVPGERATRPPHRATRLPPKEAAKAVIFFLFARRPPRVFHHGPLLLQPPHTILSSLTLLALFAPASPPPLHRAPSPPATITTTTPFPPPLPKIPSVVLKHGQTPCRSSPVTNWLPLGALTLALSKSHPRTHLGHI